jgi:hypothetical protein
VNKNVQMASAASTTITIPLNSAVPFATGSQVLLTRGGTGAVGITGSAGVTVNSVLGYLNLNYQWSSATALKTGTDTWNVYGDLKA